MDLTIAAMTDGERAMLNNVLARGLATLTKASRTPHTVAVVEKLQQVLRDTPQLGSHRPQVLKQLAFSPRGRWLRGINVDILRGLAKEGVITLGRPKGTGAEPPSGPWQITAQGWDLLWANGIAQQILADRHGITLPEVGA